MKNRRSKRGHWLALTSTGAIVAGFLAWSRIAEAADWSQWRGPDFNGSSPETRLPVAWSSSDGVAWVAPLPGYSGATPAISQDSIFVSSPNAQKELLLICLDRKTGKEKWQRVVGTGDREKGRNNMASPSPVTDGETVWVLFATGDLAAFDVAGKLLWKRQLAEEHGHFANMWIYGASPLLHGNRLYVQVLQRSPVPGDYSHATDGRETRESFLLCVNPATGKDLWRHVRATDAFSESMEAYSTPIPLEREGRTEILVVGANYTTAHDPQTGAEIWRCGGLNPKGESYWRIVPSPVTGAGMVFVCGPKRDPVFAIRAGGKGNVTDSHLAWKFSEYPSDCVTPLFYQDRLFVLDGDRQMLTCLEPQTGRKIWQGSLGTREIFRASPTGADGRLYMISESGTVVIASAGETFEILGTIRMGEPPVRSSIAVAYGQLFIRTGKNLYCIGGTVKK